MKTLYININNEQIQSNEELEVLNYDLDSDFFFYLGEKIAKGCKVENENALITDFNTQENVEDYQKIIEQWDEIKTILFSEECEGVFDFTLPKGYIHWLRYSEKYNHVYDKNFSHGESTVITIDLEELYEDSVEDLQRKILRKLQRDDLYLKIDEIAFNDDLVTCKSPIVRTIKEKYEGVGFKVKMFVESSLKQSSNIKYENKRLIKVQTEDRVFIIKDGTELIGNHAFELCYNLEEVIIPETVKVIEEGAFRECIRLKKIDLSNIEYVGDYAFWGCVNLNAIFLPMATHIGCFAFGETQISWFYIGDNVNYIGDNPFVDCYSLYDICCFSSNFESYNYALYTSKKQRLITCFTKEDSFTVPKETTHIGRNAFKGCENLTHLELSDSIIRIDSYSFDKEWDVIDEITIPFGTKLKFERLFENNSHIHFIEKDSTSFKTKRTFKIKGIEFNMIFVKAGEFTNRNGDKILLTNDYYIGETPVTQELFKIIMGDNPSYFNNIDYKNHPVEQVSWHDCVEFVNRLNSISKLDFRLPTEAEWDFAALGGVKSKNFKYCGGNNFDEVGWYACKANHKTHPVKQKFPNELGLYDMYGNVGEWCSDCGGYMTEEEELQYYEEIEDINNEIVHINPPRYRNEYTERGRVFKGDAYGPYTLDTVHRLAFEDVKLQSIGFRLVLEI